MDGPSGDEEESEASDHAPLRLLRSSEDRAKDPDEYDRLIGISLVDLSDEEDGFGDGELTDAQEQDEEVANDLRDPIDSRSGFFEGVWECQLD